MPVSAGLHLLHVDATWIVADKPSGMLAVPGRGPDKQDCLSTRIQQPYPDALIVHRLDMATSGLMLLARGAHVQRALSAAFADRQVYKRYTAVVSGLMDTVYDTWQTIELPICVDWPNRPLRIIDTDSGKPSTTRVRVVHRELTHNTTRVELEPITGRSHQLRVHLRAIGHPIVGDALYAPADVVALAPRLLLHAQVLQLAHPVHGARVDFASAVPF